MCRTLATERSRKDVRRASASGVFLAALTLLASAPVAAEPKPTPQRGIPARDLIAYVEFDGLTAHEEAWRATAAYAMLAETPAGVMMNKVARPLTGRLLKMVPGARD